MLDHRPVLVVEDEPMIAMQLANGVADLAGNVIGSYDSVDAALQALEAGSVCGAIMDANLTDRDITPVALLLRERGIPFLIYSGTGLPAELAASYPDATFVIKPGLR